MSEKTAHLSKLLEAAKWRVMGYKGDDADGQPLVHPVRNHYLSVLSVCRVPAWGFIRSSSSSPYAAASIQQQHACRQRACVHPAFVGEEPSMQVVERVFHLDAVDV